MSFLVLDAGLESRIVDQLGRPGTRSLGVPVGGAADRRSLALGNALVGNPPDAAALEIALKGPRLRVECPIGCVLFGAPFDAQRDGYPIQAGHTFMLNAGEELRVGGTSHGVRAYLCVRGGFDMPTILASRSALTPIQKDDLLSCSPSNIHVRFVPELTWSESHVVALAVLPGLQAEWFEEAPFFEQIFTLAPASNRMGLRLQGRPLNLPRHEMISEPVCPGTVQVTNDGQCIVLGVDGQTIGGYPKIAQVIQADLDTLGQLRPGQSVRFENIALEDAARRNRDAMRDLHEWTMRLRLAYDSYA